MGRLCTPRGQTNSRQTVTKTQLNNSSNKSEWKLSKVSKAVLCIGNDNLARKCPNTCLSLLKRKTVKAQQQRTVSIKFLNSSPLKALGLTRLPDSNKLTMKLTPRLIRNSNRRKRTHHRRASTASSKTSETSYSLLAILLLPEIALVAAETTSLTLIDHLTNKLHLC